MPGVWPAAKGVLFSLLVCIVVTKCGRVGVCVCVCGGGGGFCGALVCLLDGIFVRFGTAQTIGVPVGAGCAPLVADLFLFFCGREFVGSLSRGSRADIIEAFGSTSGCLDGLLNVDSVYFDQMVDRVCPAGLQLDGASSSDAGVPFLDLGLCVSNGAVSQGFVINETILILIWLVSLFWVAVSPGVPRVGCACLGLLDSPGLLRVLVTLTAVMEPLLPGFFGGAIVVLASWGVFEVLSQARCLVGGV